MSRVHSIAISSSFRIKFNEAHLAPTQPTQVNKITTSCEICSGPYDTQYCMKDPEQAFIEYASSRTDKLVEGLVSNFMASQDARLSKFEADFKQQQSEMTNKIDTLLKAIIDRITGALPSDTVKNPKLSTSSVLFARSYPTEEPQCLTHIHEFVCTKWEDGDVMFIEIVKKNDDSRKEKPKVGGLEAYINLNSPLNIITLMLYNWIMRRKLDPRENSDGGISNFMGRINGMHVFIGNFVYVTEFMIVEDMSSIIDPRLSQVLLGKPFVEISNMTHDPPEAVVIFDEDKLGNS
nr:MAK10-like protein [Tanacetum cinerariifolium]